VMITGVGSSFVEGKLYGLPSYLVPEFTAVALGGLYLSSLEKALVVSMGTGTAVVYAQKGKAAE
ncbi:MAG: pantothenate kinase, partial [Clostridia bacterium]|nr:pantothenate kinase [Clostridia bacterium]